MRGLLPGCPGRQNTCFTGVRSHVPGPLQAQLNANKGACRVGLTKPLVCIFRLGSHSIFLSHLGCRHNGRPNALLARRSPGTRPPCCAVHSSVGSPFIHPSIHPSIHPYIHASMYPCIHPTQSPFCCPICPFGNYQIWECFLLISSFVSVCVCVYFIFLLLRSLF